MTSYDLKGLVSKVVILAFLMSGVQGCSIASRDGPQTKDIVNASKKQSEQTPQYNLVNLDNSLVGVVQTLHNEGRSLGFESLPSVDSIGQIGIGDVLHITIWETSQMLDSVLSQNRGTDVQVGVGMDGNITVPYAGRFSVAGMTVSEIEQRIVQRLEHRIYNPQVTVALTENVANTVFLSGEVGHPGRFPLLPGGTHLLDVLSTAGGAKLAPHETILQVRRRGHVASDSLYHVLHDPAANIELSPGDNVICTRRQDVFYAFGAISRTGELPFSEQSSTLLQALGQASGLQDHRADPTGLFIFRNESPELAGYLPGAASVDGGGKLPVVYRLSMEDPNAFFIMKNFPIYPSDVLYVSNAPIYDFSKVMEAIMGSAGTGISAANLAVSVGK